MLAIHCAERLTITGVTKVKTLAFLGNVFKYSVPKKIRNGRPRILSSSFATSNSIPQLLPSTFIRLSYGMNVTNTKRNFCTQSANPNFEMIIVEKKGKVGLITLNRPKALNALCEQLLNELGIALKNLDKDNEIGCIVLTGSKKTFAAGADIKEMSSKSYMEVFKNKMFGECDNYMKISKPIISAVNGYALGGGCELAMIGDIMIAGENAKFGQPEINLGTIPGIGGTQRLIRAIGKSKAMEMILTGKQMDAKSAEQAGLVCRVVPEDKLVDEALSMANTIASFSKPAVAKAKDCVNRANELNLTEGLNYERKEFYGTFATNDQKEGMKAFLNKSKPNWTDS